MFGENFPYTNFHDLNMDWIIKIAKDFLDQYTHIQQIIADGETSLQNLTTEGLQQLQEKADALEALLQAWYDTHSQDIANQLTQALADLNEWYDTHSQDIANELSDALADLNEWYTTHQNYLDQTLANNISAFDTHAEQKAEQTIASIPDDYTTLSNNVTELFNQNGILLKSGYYVNDRTILTNEIQAGDVIYYSFDAYAGRYGFLSFRDANDTQLSYIGKGSAGGGETHYQGFYTVPANYDHLVVQATGTTGLTIQIISTPISNRALYDFIENITIEENSEWR